MMVLHILEGDPEVHSPTKDALYAVSKHLESVTQLLDPPKNDACLRPKPWDRPPAR